MYILVKMLKPKDEKPLKHQRKATYYTQENNDTSDS